MQPTGTPRAEVSIDEALVRSLVESQHPDLANLPLRTFGEGWDNALFLFGSEMLVRLPRRQSSAQLLRNEQLWLHELASVLPVRVPAPLRCGIPTENYPWYWSIVPRLPGQTADEQPLSISQAPLLAHFLRSLHVPTPDEAPRNPVRGVALRERDTAVRERIARLRSATKAFPDRVIGIWEMALAAVSDEAATWVHGDLHERNVLVENGRLVGVIDWGDVCQGDRATDLAAVWTLLDDKPARAEVIAEYGRDDDALWMRAKGWAVMFGVTLLDTGLVDHPAHARMGERILRRLVDGP